jgi:hypothetical protein
VLLLSAAALQLCRSLKVPGYGQLCRWARDIEAKVPSTRSRLWLLCIAQQKQERGRRERQPAGDKQAIREQSEAFGVVAQAFALLQAAVSAHHKIADRIVFTKR